jgi:hypothetical protein
MRCPAKKTDISIDMVLALVKGNLGDGLPTLHLARCIVSHRPPG